MSRSGPLIAGEPVLLIDRKKRRYLIDLAEGGEFHSHSGVLPHDELIGKPEGETYRSSRGMVFIAIRPTITDYVLKMPRGAQVVYPKDIGPIIIQADIFPGARVLESGLGSGALSTGMLRAGADIVGYELRDDFEQHARDTVGRFLGSEALERYRTQVRDVYQGIEETELDRIVLDLPEPWQVVPHAEQALRRGTGAALQPDRVADEAAVSAALLPTLGRHALRDANGRYPPGLRHHDAGGGSDAVVIQQKLRHLRRFATTGRPRKNRDSIAVDNVANLLTIRVGRKLHPPLLHLSVLRLPAFGFCLLGHLSGPVQCHPLG